MTVQTLISADELLRRANANIARPISYRQLDYWLRTGTITAAQQANGSGSARRFDPGDVARLRRVARWWHLFGTHGIERRIVSVLWESDPLPFRIDVEGCVVLMPEETAA